MLDSDLVEGVVTFATTLRMGEGVDESALARLRAILDTSAERWRQAGGVVGTSTAAALLELYPSMLGSAELYPDDQRQNILDLAEELLDEALTALSG